MDALKETVNHIILDPQYADVLAIVKAARNGAVYGAKDILEDKSILAKIPRKHSMVFLFRSGTIREKLRLILKATRQHSRNLATFAVIHKSTLLALRHFSPLNNAGKEGRYDTFLAGLIGGYAVFGRGKGAQSSVNQQISIYVFARVVLALAKLSVQPSGPLGKTLLPDGGRKIAENAWAVFASLSWAFVMYLHKWHPDTIQPSLRSSMQYIYVNADHWDSFRNFLWHNR